jgi:hypothetical protein
LVKKINLEQMFDVVQIGLKKWHLKSQETTDLKRKEESEKAETDPRHAGCYGFGVPAAAVALARFGAPRKRSDDGAFAIGKRCRTPFAAAVQKNNPGFDPGLCKSF